MQTVNARNLKDALSATTQALPAAAANVTCSGIYIGGAGPHREGLKLKVELPENSVLVATKDLDMALYDSADNSSFAAVVPAQTRQIVGDTGFDATDFYFEIPQTARAYVAVNFAVETGGGSNIATTATVSVVS